MPVTVTSIDVSMFHSCSALKKFYVYNPEPAALQSIAVIEDRPSHEFEDAVYANATLYVPRGFLESYRHAPGWSKFLKIEEFDALIEPVVVTAKSYTREYGDANPAFEYTSSGAALTGVPEITCEATASSPVGTYPIIISKGSVTNYNDTYIDGTLTITKAPLAVSVENVTREQYVENPEFVIGYSGWKLGEDESVLAAKPTATTTATKDSPVGDYPIVVSGGEAQNYALSYTNGTLTVIESTGIDEITAIRPANVYTLQGSMVRAKATTLEGLPKGVYIVNGRKVVVK